MIKSICQFIMERFSLYKKSLKQVKKCHKLANQSISMLIEGSQMTIPTCQLVIPSYQLDIPTGFLCLTCLIFGKAGKIVRRVGYKVGTERPTCVTQPTISRTFSSGKGNCEIAFYTVKNTKADENRFSNLQEIGFVREPFNNLKIVLIGEGIK